jgi:N-ethylmaleimide reductase
VEIHAANGYLPDQFMRTCSNLRNDQWGKNLEGRLAFIKDIVRGISQAIGASRCAIRLSPFITHRSMVCSEILATTYALVAWLDEHQLAYLHFAEADWEDTPLVPIEFRQKIRKLFPGIIVVAGNLDAQKGERLIKQGYADAIAFGRNYIANPNLVEKIKYGLALNPLNNATIMGSGAQGYTDYPTS